MKEKNNSSVLSGEDQTILAADGAVGDCFRACIATIIGKRTEGVPHFALLGDLHWMDTAVAWLNAHGYETDIKPVAADGLELLPLHIVQGMSQRGVLHAVVGDTATGEVAHDPHPSRAGLSAVHSRIYFFKSAAAQPEQGVVLTDADKLLCDNIDALLALDAAGDLVPHGIGGHARSLLTSAVARLRAILARQTAPTQEPHPPHRLCDCADCKPSFEQDSAPQQPAAARAAVPDDDPDELAFWRFDARKKGYSEWKGCPQSERDAFKAEWRMAFAAGAEQPDHAASSLAPVAQEGEQCAWTLDDPDNGIWQSSCGEAWSFVDGGPVENRVNFCQGCGKPVQISQQTSAQVDKPEGKA